jgi:hypothetical protein
LLARIVVDRGSPPEAVELCTASERFAAPDDLVTQAMWRAVRARILGGQGDSAGAMALARAAMELVAGIDLVNDRADVVLDAADAVRLAGDAAVAGRITSEAIALYEGKGNLVSAARARSRPPAGAPV